MKINITKSKKQLDPASLLALEHKLRITLSKDYRDFILHNNGGQPKPCVFSYKGVDGFESQSVINWFHAIYDGEENNFESTYLFYSENGRIPPSVVPIASDPGGNMICMSISGNDRGMVYFWDHELESSYSGAKNLALLSNSFSDFLNLLEPEE